MTLSVIEALNDAKVLATLKKALAPSTQEIIEAVTARVTSHLSIIIKKKDDEITDLKERVTVLETALVTQEQYSRRENLRFSGIPETERDGTTEEVIINMINNEMALNPPITTNEIARCHRVGENRRKTTTA